MNTLRQAPAASTFALRDALPRLNVPRVALGCYPTPVTAMPQRPNLWLKREDASSPLYGGNKLRTLETLLGDALERGFKRVWTLGAYGSNQALALFLHGRTLGLRTGAVLFPQRATPTGAENLRASLSHADELRLLRTVATFPLHWWALSSRTSEYLVTPGGAVPLGALGHVSAALELAGQVQRGELPPPAHIVLAIGSRCTTAGLLAGLPLARRLGLWPWPLPTVHAVRVTPWPITGRALILKLARATAREIAVRGGPEITVDPTQLQLHTRQFGRGYARITPAGNAAADQFQQWGGPPLDSTYAAKSAAALLAMTHNEPTVYWCTKSSAPMPAEDEARIQAAPKFIQRWLNQAQ